MIITIAGKAGSGKSTIARMLAKKLGLDHYSSGDFMRELAREKGKTITDFSKEAETDGGKIDKEIDERQKKLGKEQDDFVIDGRLSSFFIPKANFKIFLDVKLDVGAKRIIGDKRDTEEAKDIDKMKDKMQTREESEVKRYKEYYGFNAYDKKNYDLVIDTSKVTPEQIIEKIIKLVRKE